MFEGRSRASATEMRERVRRDHGFTPDRSNSHMLANNTLEFSLPNGGKTIRYHDTDVIEIDSRGTVTLNSGGWRTPTTKERINMGLPAGCYIYSSGGWLIKTPKGLFPFADGAKFKADGTPVNPKLLEKSAAKEARDKKLVARFLRNAAKNGWHDPAGDPWVFSQPSRSVMLDWLQSDYFTARLCSLALESRFGPAGVSIYMSDLVRKGGKPDGWIKTLLRRYIYASLGIGQ